MRSSIISTTADSISSGGTITGDLTISGDLTVSGDSSGSYSEIITDGLQITKDTDGEFVSLILVNESDAASTAGIISQRFDLEDTGGTAVDSGKILVGKEASFTATASTQDSYMALHTSLNGTLAEKVRITSAGNVGIGNTVPAKALQIGDASNNTGNGTIRLQGYSSGGSGNYHDIISYGDNLQFYRNTTLQLHLNYNGLVGIGTAAPTAAKLEIHGGNYSTSLLIKGSGADTGIKFVDSAGNTDGWIYAEGGEIGFLDDDGNWAVKVVTDTSTSLYVNNSIKLLVDANSRISLSNNDSGGTGGSDSTSGNTIFGYLSGASVASGGLENTFLGHKAGNSISTGDGNTLIGSNCATAWDAESNNTAVGYDAMNGGVNGADSCVAVGKSALAGAVTQDGTVAIGASALTALTSGAGNVAIGYQAGLALTTGSSNTVLGYGALDDMVEGGNNIAIGKNAIGGALDATADASTHNVAVGKDALGGAWVTAVSEKNVGIGNETLMGAMNGVTGAVAVGHSALTALTTGAGNVAIGYEALKTATDASKMTAVGYKAFNLAAPTGGGKDGEGVAIGYLAGSEATAVDGATYVGGGCGSTLTGGYNTAVGSRTLYDTDAGGSSKASAGNTVLGYFAMGGTWTNVTIDNCVAIGRNALDGALAHADVSGTVAIGRSALGALTSGAGNTAVGYNSLLTTATGAKNTAIGYEALKLAIDGGDQCTAVGYMALDAANNQYSDKNTAVGSDALGANTSGQQNTGLGANTGATLTTGDACVILGENSDVSTADAQNQIIIGQGVTGVANNSVTLGNASVTAVYMASDSGATVYCSGVNFPDGTSHYSADANTLDDYEEGTWTPTLTNMTIGSGTVTATYTKIGRQINLYCKIILAADSTVDGAWTFYNLPFATTYNQFGVRGVFYDNGTNFYPLWGYSISNRIYVRETNGNSAISASIPFTWANGDELHWSMIYED